MNMCTSLCPWHQLWKGIGTNTALAPRSGGRSGGLLAPQWRPQCQSVGTARPCRWRQSIWFSNGRLTGGALSKLIGLDVKEIETPSEAVSFVRLEKNSAEVDPAHLPRKEIRRERSFMLDP